MLQFILYVLYFPIYTSRGVQEMEGYFAFFEATSEEENQRLSVSLFSLRYINIDNVPKFMVKGMIIVGCAFNFLAILQEAH